MSIVADELIRFSSVLRINFNKMGENIEQIKTRLGAFMEILMNSKEHG